MVVIVSSVAHKLFLSPFAAHKLNWLLFILCLLIRLIKF